MESSELVKRISGGNAELLKFQAKQIKPNVSRLHMGDPGMPTPEHICDAAREAMRQGYTHYIIGRGDKDLVATICETMKENYDCSYEPEGIVITHGGMGAIFNICLAFLSPGDEAIVFNPSYPNYPHNIRLVGATPVWVPYAEDFSLDQHAVKKAITKKTKAIFFVNPNNPTGIALTREEVEFLADLAVQYNLLLVSDEAYRSFYYDGKRHVCLGSIPAAKNHTITIHSLSKTYAMTGWRIGYVATTPEIAQPINIIQRTSLTCINTPTQRAAIAALKGPQDFVKEMVREYDRRRGIISAKLSKIKGFDCVLHDSAYYFYGRFDADMTSAEMVDYLLEKKVAVRSGAQFGTRGEGWIRLSYCGQFKEVMEGIERFVEALREFQ